MNTWKDSPLFNSCDYGILDLYIDVLLMNFTTPFSWHKWAQDENDIALER